MNNAIINGFRLKDLLNILDARTRVTVYTGITSDDKITEDSVNVYELLASEDFIKTYGKQEVKGLVSFISTTNILIGKTEKGEG